MRHKKGILIHYSLHHHHLLMLSHPLLFGGIGVTPDRWQRRSPRHRAAIHEQIKFARRHVLQEGEVAVDVGGD